MNSPVWSSVMAWRSCSWVFMTMGPYQATGSSMRLAGDEQEADAFRTGLDLDLVAAIEEDERVVARVVDGLRVRVDS